MRRRRLSRTWRDGYRPSRMPSRRSPRRRKIRRTGRNPVHPRPTAGPPPTTNSSSSSSSRCSRCKIRTSTIQTPTKGRGPHTPARRLRARLDRARPRRRSNTRSRRLNSSSARLSAAPKTSRLPSRTRSAALRRCEGTSRTASSADLCRRDPTDTTAVVQCPGMSRSNAGPRLWPPWRHPTPHAPPRNARTCSAGPSTIRPGNWSGCGRNTPR
mmetsp:Transcript_10672/g.29813  ORF Transcript_10672/g.29813 Transcript_10672/m.29813 type:complete len:213 (-) Transcript_10672:2659-3297(-)